MRWTRMNDSAPKGLSKVTESKDLSESSWEDTGSGQEVRTWEIPCQSMTVLSIAAEMAVSNLSCKHGSSFLVTNVFLSVHPAASIRHHLSCGFWIDPGRCSTWCFWLWTATWLQKHLVWAVLRYLPDYLPSSFSRQQQTLPFVCGPFGTWPLPASCNMEGGNFFLSLGPFPSSFCMGVAARSPQQYWIPALWVKAGRLPAEEMLWKWDLLLLCRGTGYFRSRLCWRYGLGQDYCSCWGKCCCIQSFPISKAIDIT